MRHVALAIGIVMSVVGFSGQAEAKQLSGPQFAIEHGQSLPPIGFVKFCASNPAECRSVGRNVNRMAMTPADWNTLYKVNTAVNTMVRPVSDLDLYGEVEYWAYPVEAGDCEDYLLLKKKYLEGLGFDEGALLITVVLDEKNEGHAILTVASKQGDFVLDNRRDEILRWSDVSYRFLKRQSQEDPRQWVALMKQAAPAASVSGSKPGN
jgi:predicted transglutaminase-like cysteine proteinase